MATLEERLSGLEDDYVVVMRRVTTKLDEHETHLRELTRVVRQQGNELREHGREIREYANSFPWNLHYLSKRPMLSCVIAAVKEWLISVAIGVQRFVDPFIIGCN